jgi:diacylglycerol O-acyltransferase
MDAMFLYGETPDTMMHVAGLMPFTSAPDAGPDYLRRLVHEIRTEWVVQPPWNMKLKTPGFLLNPFHQWVEDPDFDIEYHVRRSALPAPGDERELGVLVSRLHSNPLDLSRPPWELHLIEGLENGRWAAYVKFHHALVDGYSAIQLLNRSLSKDPASRAEKLFFAVPPARRERPAPASSSTMADVGMVLGRAVAVTKSVPDLVKSLVKLQVRRDGEFKHLTSSYEAPHSVLNSKVGRNRRFATQQYDIARLTAVAKAGRATLNDVVLTICGGGLRRFLSEMDALGDKPLIGFLPVNVRPKGDVGGGNAVGAILATMGTDIEDPVRRLKTIARSTKQAKDQLVDLPQESILAYSAMLMAPAATQVLAAMTGLRTPMPFTFNLCVSNVPGPREVLYFRGARLEADYPVSIPVHGMALNITCQSYGGTLCFGFVGDRDALPSLQRLAVYTGEELARLEAGLGLSGDGSVTPIPAPREKSGARRAAVTAPGIPRKRAVSKAAPRKRAPRSSAG